MTRRQILQTMGSGFGMMSLRGLMASESPVMNPLAPKAPHFPAKAKHVIYLFLNGGVSQVDTWDPKPMLTKYHGKPIPSGNLQTERKTGTLLKSPFEFKKCGQSGIEISEIFSKVGERIDDICVVRSLHTNRPNHEPSLFRLNCGNPLPGHPSMGSWLTYGLGTENQNLPGYVVLSPGYPVVGPQLWSSNFLPAVHQGPHIPNNETDPEKLIQHIRNTKINASDQRKQLDLLAQLNRIHIERAGEDPELEASIQSMETAYRMQTEALEAFDIRKESEQPRANWLSP